MGYQVGDTVFVGFRDERQARRNGEATISKMGRKWAYLEPTYLGRFDINSGFMDGGGYSSPARVWPSEDDYRQARDREERWRYIYGRISRMYGMPERMTDADLATLEEIFGIGTNPE